MIVQEVEVAPGEAVDLRERVVDVLGVELLAALEEGDLVAEVAHVRAAARDDDRVRHQVAVALDQVAADAAARRRACAAARRTAAVASPRRKSSRKLGPRVLAGPEEDGVGVPRGLVRQRRDVQSAERDVHAPPPVVVGDLDTHAEPR